METREYNREANAHSRGLWTARPFYCKKCKKNFNHANIENTMEYRVWECIVCGASQKVKK